MYYKFVGLFNNVVKIEVYLMFLEWGFLLERNRKDCVKFYLVDDCGIKKLILILLSVVCKFKCWKLMIIYLFVFYVFKCFKILDINIVNLFEFWYFDFFMCYDF